MPAPAPSSSAAGVRRRAPDAPRWERYGLAGLLLAVIVVGGLVVIAPADSTATDRRVAVQALLDAWAGAIRAGDEDALAAVIDPDAARGLLTAELRRMSALAAVPLADFGYELGPEPLTPVAGDVAARFGDDPVSEATVYLRYAVDGIDEPPTRKPVTALLVERPSGWRLVDDEAAAADPGGDSGTWRGPWDYGPLVVLDTGTAGGSSLVMGHPDRRELIEAVAAELGSAVDAVSEVWGATWSQRALVVVTGSQEEFTHLVGTSHNGAEIAAVAVSDAVDPARDTATGQRIVFSPTAGERLSRAGLRAVLRHELVHIAARSRTVDGSPLWILEGYADYIGYRGSHGDRVVGGDVARIAPALTEKVRGTGPPVALPPDGDFTDPIRSRAAYETSWSLAAFTADQFGLDRLTSLYRALAAGPVPAGRLDAVLSETTGLDTDTFLERWARWLSANVDSVRG
ncbi:hypothetical protein [Rhodococcus chondri]|uniref:Peptidase n=1 Tax=Rhodococcus chondri TaxID=3065941 RepID=A0ABU7JND7_9NOCA|nr:hypothetical protein [Rhodococcus sp. CC-R104]MEE2031545.1 hypothetical protein [Rhodococcus sp. CC-R104]